MAELIRYNLDGGGVVLVETDEDAPGMTPASRARDVIDATSTSFGSALSGVRQAAGEALREFRELDVRPDELTIEFGVRLTVEAGAVIARTGGEGHLKVTLLWQSEQRRAAGA